MFNYMADWRSSHSCSDTKVVKTISKLCFKEYFTMIKVTRIVVESQSVVKWVSIVFSKDNYEIKVAQEFKGK